MKKFLVMGFYLLLGLSLVAGCGSGGNAIMTAVPPHAPTPPPHTPPPPPPPFGLRLANPAPSAPQGNVGQWFELDPATWTVGGELPISVSLKSGTLPAGLALNSPNATAVLGIPTIVSATNVVFTVTDSETPPRSVDVPILITINPMLPLTISPASGALPDGEVGMEYNLIWHCLGISGKAFPCRKTSGVYVQGAGGFIPYTFGWAAAARSSLPPGITLSNNLIDGTPTAAGTYSFVVTVTDSESPPKKVSATYTITVKPAPSPSPSP